jgi:serine/threonine protein kinase/Leucine-rich repeat (LRR) protein
MPVPLETFVKNLTDSGVISAGKLENFLPPKATPKDAQELAKQLVQSKQLTKYQAAEIYQGRAKSLILGNYTILDKIGAGGMGQVFKAQHRRMKRVVAIKVLPKHVTRDAAAVARFQREVEAAAKLEHPNIVTAHDADEADGVHFLVMQCVEGQDLSALVKKNGPLSVAQAVRCVLQAARGLDYAHKHGVVHRDIKPGNLLLNAEGTVKILDMGLARIEAGGDAATQAELTGTGAVMGTVDYMAPEQALDTKHADARADIYSLGCTLFYLLSGKPMYEADTLAARLLAHQGKPIPNLRNLRDDVPVELDAVFRQMVAKTVEDRYQTMSEVVAALESIETGQQSSIGKPQSIDTNAGDDALTFLRDASAHTTHKPKPARKTAPATTGKNNKKIVLGAVAAGLVGLAVLAGIALKSGSPEKTAATAGKPWESRDFKKWIESVAAMPAEKQLEAVGRKMQELNPQFDGKFFCIWNESIPPVPQGGNVVELGISTDNIADLSPVRALSELKYLECHSKRDAGRLLDLSPLNGMKIFSLKCVAQGLDLSSVKVLPLSELICVGGRITDISPISGLPLHVLKLSGNWGFTNLKPVAGMPLTSFACDNSQVADLSPLSGMRLTELICHVTQVADLSPLKGMPLESLYCDRTPITDFSPLTGMKLKKLSFTPAPGLKGVEVIRQMDSLVEIGTGEHDLFPASEFWKKYDAGDFGKPAPEARPSTANNDPDFKKWIETVVPMPAEQQVDAVILKLKELNPQFDGKLLGNDWDESSRPLIEGGNVVELVIRTDNVANLSPIRAFSELKGFRCREKQKTTRQLDLSALSGMKIRSLTCENIDLPTVKGLPLSELQCYRSKITDLAPISGLPLRSLMLHGNWELTSLEPLRGMSLTALCCDNSQVADLSPLSGMPLTVLVCPVTRVVDLSPLKGMPLEDLYCDRTLVTDLSPLAGMKLKRFSFTPAPTLKGVEVIRQMDSLVEMGAEFDKLIPRREFWQRYDAGEFGKPAPETKPVTTYKDPAFKKWVKAVAKLPAEKQIEEVRKELKELNPEFDGKLSAKTWDESGPPTIEDGKVVGLLIYTDKVADLSPIRAFSELRHLECRSRQKTGRRLDLSPLIGMKIRSLVCVLDVVDLPAVKNLPLTQLACFGGVTDLSLISGMPLERLTLSGNWNIKSLGPLKGMPLTSLWCDNTQVADLSPLRGMQLTELICPVTQVADLSPLQGMPLETLNCDGTLVTDLSPLAGMKLKRFSFTPKPGLKGIEVIRQMDSLVEIGAKYDKFFPRSEFWQKYDAGAFNSP